MTKNNIAKHFDNVSGSYDQGKLRYAYYYTALKKLLKELIGENKKVFELGCGTGDLLASLEPKSGYGQDISSEMIKLAKRKYKNKKFLKFSVHTSNKKIFAPAGGKYEYIFMSDVIEHLSDPLEEFIRVRSLMTPNSKFIITMANPVWEPILMLWEKLGLKMKEGPHKRIGYKDVKLLGVKSDLKIVKHNYTLLIPIYIPFVTYFVNKYLEKFLKRLAFIEYFVLVKS